MYYVVEKAYKMIPLRKSSINLALLKWNTYLIATVYCMSVYVDNLQQPFFVVLDKRRKVLRIQTILINHLGDATRISEKVWPINSLLGKF